MAQRAHEYKINIIYILKGKISEIETEMNSLKKIQPEILGKRKARDEMRIPVDGLNSRMETMDKVMNGLED